ncbi:MAG: N-6 DNA methylase, partial [Burkholderiaceae bacterium]|nr:N-6 DNA methylase [Burkholderiaceae bacterium]
TRLLFCLFADDTGIFGADGIFRRLVEQTREDGRDTGARLAELFDVLDTPESERQSSLDETLAAFAYINGSLFAERTRIPAFDGQMRALLVACAELDWSGISPAIFGAMFQGVLEAHHPDEARQATRRELGAHYTSERNILRVIDPLFMDDLRAELRKARHSKPRLRALYDRLAAIRCFDPACGCGNFLVIAYRELRRLENEVIAALFGQERGLLDVTHLCRVRVSQFHGIEIDQAAAHIARVALWITDHQMNLESARRFGTTRPTVPLVDTPHILCANALRTDWAAEMLPPAQCSYVFGNPPFVGAKWLNPAQREEARAVLEGIKNGGLLDYVAAWYVKALAYLKANPAIDAAFVSTNSITQGEQVAALWPYLLQGGVKIRFAHRTFKWSNEGMGNAAVHCVIIGFGLRQPEQCTLFDYTGDIKADAGRRIEVARINPYLVDGPDVVVQRRSVPLCRVPPMKSGNKPIDDGQYLFTPQEKNDFLAHEPQAKSWFRRWLGGEEFINSIERWCLWLGDCPPKELRAMPLALKRVQTVKNYRAASKSAPTQALAATPTRFHTECFPAKPYIALPQVSSERRDFVPIAFLGTNVLCGDKLRIVENGGQYIFAMLTSTMHMAWMRAVCGRLESRYQYSAAIVYNNYPWPDPTDKQREALETTGQAILDARALYPDATLADLYDPLTMPPELRRAHAVNDRAVDAAYGYKADKSDAARVAFLFDLYGKLTNLLPTNPSRPKRRKRTTDAVAESERCPSNKLDI